MNPARFLLSGWLALACLASPVPAQTIRNGILVPEPGEEPDPKAVPPRRPNLLVVVDFDDVSAPCLFRQTTPLRDAYAEVGVTFSGPGILDGGAILDQCGNFCATGYSPPNFLAFNSDPISFMQNGGFPILPERIQFAQDVAAVQLLLGGPMGHATLTAYSATDTPLGSDSIDLACVMQGLTVSAPGIRYAILEVEKGDVLVVDDLSFDLTPTPAAPASWGRLKTIYR